MAGRHGQPARPLTESELAPVLAPLGTARGLPGRAFVDDEIFAFEQEHIFGRAWICVGRVDDVKLPGAWLRETVAGEPILVVRGPDLRLRAFFDVCRHRGASLVAHRACGRGARIVCPYHGWTYELDGRLATAPFARAEFDDAAHGLHEARVDVWHGFVFVTLSAELPALTGWLVPFPPWFEALGPIERGHRAVYEVAANWKLCVENFQESHHFSLVHRALEHLTPTGSARTWLSDGPWLGGTMEIADADAETVSLDGSRHDRPFVVPEDMRRTIFDAMLFPALLTSVQPDYLLTYRLTPLAPARTRVVFDVHFHPAALGPAFAPTDVIDFWERVNAEDAAICAEQQENASSRAFEPAVYATVEEGVHAFDRRVAAAHVEAPR